MSDIQIAPWNLDDRDEVIDFIVSIQQGEFDLSITAADQPDLADVEAAYRATGGQFLVARHQGQVVGTIAAIVVEDNTVALRKMFVHRDHRGASGLAARLMDSLVDWSRRAGYRTILLGTTDRMTAAHRFYEKHNFTRMSAAALPAQFPRMAVDSVFFRRDLPGVVSIREYDATWTDRYEVERRRIVDALGDLRITIEHCGSTSVPGLPAKPIIDIVMTVPDSTDEEAYFSGLLSIGYNFTLREPEWYQHRLFNRDWPRVNLHTYSTGCDEVDTMLLFRDHLRCNTADRELYSAAKRHLATRQWAIVQDYADAQSDIVADIMSRAR